MTRAPLLLLPLRLLLRLRLLLLLLLLLCSFLVPSRRPLYERALTGFEKALGPDHPHTLATISNLASLLRNMGDKVHARRLYERALAGSEKSLGPEHPDTVRNGEHLASLLEEIGEISEASSLRATSVRVRASTVQHTEDLRVSHQRSSTQRSSIAPSMPPASEKARA